MSSTSITTSTIPPATATRGPSAEVVAEAPARLDSFTPIHKALRRALFDTAIQLARTDFEAADETAAAERATTACLDFLREHAEHEDRHVIPHIAALDPALAESLAVDHPKLERAAIAVDTLWPRIAAASGASGAATRAALGRELVRRFQGFVAQQIQHMDREEREGNAVLWSGLSDAEIGAISGRIVAEIPPLRMAQFRELFSLALSRPEREAMLRNAA